jgi:hypothetical protein
LSNVASQHDDVGGTLKKYVADTKQSKAETVFVMDGISDT